MIGQPTVSVVLTLHKEGMLLGATLRSLDRAIAYAEQRGLSVETIVSLDKADQLTAELVSSWAGPNVRLVHNQVGDLGLSRNSCVAHARGEFVAILDGDDLFARNWVADAVTAARADTRKIVWHPEVNLYFDMDYHILRHIDMEHDAFDPLILAASNPWTALCFARRALFEALPYPASDMANGIGYEDWGWNRRAIELGYIHKVVIGTGHAIRRKSNSLVKQANAARSIPVPTNMFRDILALREAAGSQ